jgi:hypothetical protein
VDRTSGDWRIITSPVTRASARGPTDESAVFAAARLLVCRSTLGSVSRADVFLDEDYGLRVVAGGLILDVGMVGR